MLLSWWHREMSWPHHYLRQLIQPEYTYRYLIDKTPSLDGPSDPFNKRMQHHHFVDFWTSWCGPSVILFLIGHQNDIWCIEWYNNVKLVCNQAWAPNRLTHVTMGLDYICAQIYKLSVPSSIVNQIRERASSFLWTLTTFASPHQSRNLKWQSSWFTIANRIWELLSWSNDQTRPQY